MTSTKRTSRYGQLLLLLLLVSSVAFSQAIIKGTVQNIKDNAPLPGASVSVKGTSTAVVTDAGGNFSVEADPAKATLVVSNVGFVPQEFRLNGKTFLSVFLSVEDKAMSDVVVIGYQDVQRRKTTAAVSTVKGKDIENIPYPTFDQMLQGRVAGLTVLSVSGEPGANNIVNIRGTTSVVENGVSSPLYVIDGIVFDVTDMPSTYGNSNPLSSINPNDIESIDVLKDASASAIYGARAANGVILVKTKRPKSGKPEFRVSSYFGKSDRPALKPIVVGAAERRMKMALLQQGGNYSTVASGALSPFLTDSLNPAFNNRTDWQGLFLHSANLSKMDASVSGNEEKYGYRLAVGRTAEEGVMKGYGFQSMTPRLFLMLKPAKNVTLTNNLYMSFVKSQHGRGDGARYPFSAWGFPSSFWNLSEQDIQAYIGSYDNIRDDDRSNTLNGNTKLEVALLPGLSIASQLSYNMINNRRDWLYDQAVNPSGRTQAINIVNSARRWELENYLSYYKTLGKDHNLNLLLGQGAEEQVNHDTYVSGTGIPLSAIKTVQGVAPGSDLYATSGTSERSRLSLFGRASYNYKNRYMLDLNYRRDASSRYGRDNRWGSFPAVSAGWIVSDEKFFQPFNRAVSFLKFRGSYGITGVDPGSYYAQYINLTTDAGYYNSTLGLGASGQMTTYNGTTVAYPNYYAAAAAREISWERSPQANLGMDLNLLRDRVAITADWYVRDSKDKIFDVTVPTTTGYSTVSNNFVSLRNTGLEFNITTTNRTPRSKLQWSTNFNVAYNQNYVTRLPNGGRDFYYGPPWMRRSLSIGQPLFSFQVWQVDGIYASDKEVPVDPLTAQRMRWGSATGPFFGAGDPARRDMNGDYIINDLDRVTLGNPNPDITGGISNTLSYKGFSVSVLCTFISGRKLWNGYLSDKMQDAGTNNPYAVWGPNSGPASDFKDARFWQQVGDDAQYPALITNSVDKWHIAQSFYVEDASFFRLKTVNLGYALPQPLVKRLKLKNLRFYGVLDNLLVLSRATVPDPEAVEANGYSSGNDYPIPKKMTLGLELSF
ncbi:SusC/RagA family TonB-linked outer membrane protein [Paraflavisolibacter sp. H34]|uniref:SusC/RagA family TonB-linked outer membrane protein n=1 Tax=Huijunlia imazamoxiresistens TaxID=3127457 RepID=UPI00301A38FA